MLVRSGILAVHPARFGAKSSECIVRSLLRISNIQAWRPLCVLGLVKLGEEEGLVGDSDCCVVVLPRLQSTQFSLEYFFKACGGTVERLRAFIVALSVLKMVGTVGSFVDDLSQQLRT